MIGGLLLLNVISPVKRTFILLTSSLVTNVSLLPQLLAYLPFLAGAS